MSKPPCPACGKTDYKRLYGCRHCKKRVCFRCVFIKNCCGIVPPEHRKGNVVSGKKPSKAAQIAAKNDV
jgi:hypothetical protein